MKTQTNKEQVFLSFRGEQFVTLEKRTWTFDFLKEGNRYWIIINYLGYRMKVKESDFNLTDTDSLLKAIEIGIEIA